MRFVPSLSIERAEGALRYRLDVPERDLHEPILEEFRQPLDEGTLRALLASAEALLRSPESSGFAQEARARGQVLYRTLVPPRLREKLKAVSGPLLISTSLYGVPWELLHDEEEFWGLRYALGKRLVLDRPMLSGPPARLRARPRVLVIGSDPRGDLPFVRREVEEICETLEGAADIVCVVDHLASFETVSAYLGEGFDLIHYSGHVVSGPETGPALLLAEERPLTTTVIEANAAGRPLVFLNACASARDSLAPPTGAWEATVSSVANAFLFGGAVAVVGTLADVSDRHAARLAEGFYRRVLEPSPIGEALRGARVECRQSADSAGSPTWLSFVLYGNPGQTLLRGGTVVQLPRPTTVPTPEPEAPRPEPVAPPAAAPAPPARTARRRFARALGIVALLVAAVGLGIWVPRHLQPAPAAPIVVGVMEVRARTPNVPSWMRELTRDGLNTILGKFPPIKVYSRQKIDFLQEKRHLSEIEAAEALGMSKMLSAGIAVDEKNVTLDLDIVDIRTGLLEATERVVGPPEKLMELENELAVRALRALGVDPTEEQVNAILASRGNEMLDAYRMFTETFGGGGEPTAGEPRAPTPAPAPVQPGEPRSEKPGVPATGPRTSWLSWQGVAWADEGDADDAAIRALLHRYAAALQARSVDQVASLQPGLTAADREKLANYFANARDLRVQISDVDVLREGDEAVASFTRRDQFTDEKTGQPRALEISLSAKLKRGTGGDWAIAVPGAPR